MHPAVRQVAFRVHSIIVPVVFVCAALLALHAQAATPMSPEAQGKIRAATFEVVMLKPKQDSLTYERPLPLDLIPYQERTDQYRSIGTAFSIGGGRYVSAAHVIAAGLRSQFGEPALRDNAGKVYAIDRIHKYSVHEDFIVFSAKDLPQGPSFEPNVKPTLNETVYAVGNAYGEGVVIRDGLYTSDTPEEQDGRWKWLRFSAAASPGNSGGPLLDSAGRVIGVVLRKSQSENLNYAVSIAQVMNAKDGLAVTDDKMTYSLPNTKITETQSVHHEFALPLDFTSFERALSEFSDRTGEGLLRDLMRKNPDKLFPRSTGSVPLLHAVYSTTFPYLIAEKPDQTWDAFQPQDSANSDLPNNGFIAYGALGGYSMIRVRRPDDVSAHALFTDSKLYMDWLLKSMAVNRNVGPQSVRVTSLGKARDDTTFVDSYKRKWQVRRWYIEYNDAVVISYALPTPEGYVGFLRTVPTFMLTNIELDMKTLTDFIYVSYGGTLGQWKEFLAERALLPDIFSSIDIGFDYDKQFHYRSKRFSLEHTPDLQKIRSESYLMLSFAYFNENNTTVWDVGAVSLMESLHGENMFMLHRRSQPAQSLPDSLKTDWDKLAAGRYPYDGTPVFSEGTTTINTFYHLPDDKGSIGVAVKDAVAKPGKPGTVMYAVSYVAEGEQGREKMGATLNTLLKGIKIQER